MVLAGVALLAPFAAARAQVPPSASDQDGRELAQKLCSNCHATDPEGARTARPDVPSFRAIANGPRAAPERLAAAIILPHPEMPGVPLTRAEIRAIIEYISTLRKAP